MKLLLLIILITIWIIAYYSYKYLERFLKYIEFFEKHLVFDQWTLTSEFKSQEKAKERCEELPYKDDMSDAQYRMYVETRDDYNEKLKRYNRMIDANLSVLNNDKNHRDSLVEYYDWASSISRFRERQDEMKKLIEEYKK